MNCSVLHKYHPIFSNWQEVLIHTGNVMSPNCLQAITWTQYDLTDVFCFDALAQASDFQIEQSKGDKLSCTAERRIWTRVFGNESPTDWIPLTNRLNRRVYASPGFVISTTFLWLIVDFVREIWGFTLTKIVLLLFALKFASFQSRNCASIYIISCIVITGKVGMSKRSNY